MQALRCHCISRHGVWGALLSCSLWLQPCVADQLAPISMVLNTENKGEFFVILTDKKDVLVAEEDLRATGINHKGSSLQVDNKSYISLRSLETFLNFKIDERNSSLIINVDPRLLQKTVVDYSPAAGYESRDFRIDSAFINYAVSQTTVSGQNFRSLEVPLEGVVGAHGVLIRSQFTYRDSPAEASWYRGMTSVVKDRPADMQRIVVGDFTATSGEFGGSGIFAGLSINKNFMMAPYFNKNPGVNFGGLLSTPSKVDVYVNDMLIRSQQLPAGEYELSNLPNIYGSGEARIVITDAFGRQREEFIPYYVASRLLRPGLHEYSHNFGVTRDSVESPQPVYGAQPAVLGFHRKGINAMLTAGIQYEAMGDVVAFRPEFVFLLRNYGEVELGGGYSQRQEEAGTLGYIRYNFISNYFHVRLAYSGSSPSYKTISTTATSDPNVRYVNATLGTHSTPLGALSGMYTRQEYLSGKLTESYSVTYNMRLPKQMSFFARANRTFENGIGRDNYFVSLSMILGRWSSANVAYTQDGDKYVRSGYAQRSVPVGTGLGFRLHVSGDQDMRTTDELRSDLSLFYNAKHGMLSGRYYAQPLGVSYSTSASGSLAFTDGEFFLTRPIADSFGLVKVGQLDSVRVYFSNEYLGETDNGKLLIPHMTSYSPNVVAIEPQDVPVELSLSNTRQFVIPFFRAASVINFPVSRFQGFSGKVHISEKGKALVPDYGDIVLQNKTDSFRAPIGRKGEFYFENLPPGRYKAMVIVEKWRCQTSLDVPASESTLVELGDMHCDL